VRDSETRGNRITIVFCDISKRVDGREIFFGRVFRVTLVGATIFMPSSQTTSRPEITLRGGKPEDAVVLGEICYRAFSAIADAHSFPHDFPNVEAAIGLASMMLARPDCYSVVAEYEGKIAGSNFLWEGDPVKGVGPITVDPAVQNSSIGRALMEDVLAHAAASKPLAVRLVQSAYHNRSLSLYTKLGFDAVEPLSMIQGAFLGLAIEGMTVRPMTADDIAAADDLSQRVHGHARHGEVAGAVQQGTAQVVERGGRITGYTVGVGFFGHTIGETNDDLKALIAAAESFSGPGFLLPTRNSELLRWCLNNGLRIIQPMTLMSTGFYQAPKGVFLPSVLY
jgi:GNAT superfamily N-acetyltransferase